MRAADKTRRIHVGDRIGELTVAAQTGSRKGGYIVWECKCSCGGKILLDTRCLQRETVKDCGCITKVKPGQKDLTGQRFGRLVCVSPAGTQERKGVVLWNCRCDCGNLCQAPSAQLTKGYKKSCGCLGHPPLKDFVGKRFGKLVVTEYSGKSSGMHRWKCICDCGNETTVGQTLLQNGRTKSCGCLQSKRILQNLKLCDGTSVTILEATGKKQRRGNSSGYTGVYQNKRTGKWTAQITFKGKTYYLGSFENIEDAVEARQQGETMHKDFLQWYYETRNGNPMHGGENHEE